MPDYVPTDDDDFNTYVLEKFLPYATSNAPALGLTEDQITALTALVTAWNYAWPAHVNAQSAAQGATIEKNAKRAGLEEFIRQLAAFVQANPNVTNTQKELLGVTVRKTTRTPVEAPTTIPLIQKIDTSTRAILRLNFVDSSTPDSRAKPAGVRACEIREQIGGAMPLDPEAMPFLCMESRSPYRADFDAEDIGKVVYFACRWTSTRNQPGPWSQVYSAVIPS